MYVGALVVADQFEVCAQGFFFFLAQADWIGSRFPHWKGRVVWSSIIAIFSIIFVCPCVREAVSAAGGEFLQLQKGKRPELLCSSSTACVEEASRNPCASFCLPFVQNRGRDGGLARRRDVAAQPNA